jgi:hypothetical protein
MKYKFDFRYNSMELIDPNLINSNGENLLLRFVRYNNYINNLVMKFQSIESIGCDMHAKNFQNETVMHILTRRMSFTDIKEYNILLYTTLYP